MRIFFPVQGLIILSKIDCSFLLFEVFELEIIPQKTATVAHLRRSHQQSEMKEKQ
jgi:hypothetical protein